jgi:arylsulfatase A-like enzyme
MRERIFSHGRHCFFDRLLSCLILGTSPVLVSQESTAKPNVVVIMADDLGWRDLHCYGNEALDTPVLDRFASEGMRFTDAYAASPVCSPTRAAMMTGKAPARLHLTNHAPGHEDGFSIEGSDLREAASVRRLDLSYTTVAERLSTVGYRTGHIGKWHLSWDQNSLDRAMARQG